MNTIRAINNAHKIILNPPKDTPISDEDELIIFAEDDSTIFYFNDSDGNTVIYNERYDGENGEYSSKAIQEKGLEEKLTIQQEIEPKANRMVAFDGLYIHTGSVPAKHNTRVILNSNFS